MMDESKDNTMNARFPQRGPTPAPPETPETPAGPQDALLSRVLDEALQPPAAPASLPGMIFDQTAHRLPRRVLGLAVGYVALRRMQALAAGIVLAGSVGVLLVGSGILRDAHFTAEARQDLADLTHYQGPHTDLDREIRRLALHIDDASARSYRDRDTAQAVQAMDDMIPPTHAFQAVHDEWF